MRDKRRRGVERVKTMLIVLLSLSAAFLIWQSPLVQSSGLAALWGSDGSGSNGGRVTTVSAPGPFRMVVGGSQGRYGIQYDQDALDDLFAQTSPLLGDALATAGEAETIDREQWQARLTDGTYIYFDFYTDVPLSTLRTWLKGSAAQRGLTGSARWLLLAEEADGSISLCGGEEDGRYWRCATALSAELHLLSIVESITPNGAFFAFEDKTVDGIVEPYTLLDDGTPQKTVYSSAVPTILSDEGQTAALLNALSFGGQNRATVPEGLLCVDGEDTLRLSGNGRVVYDDAGGGRYPAGEGLSGAVEAAWGIAGAAMGTLSGDAKLQLLSAREMDGGYIVTFGYTLSGSPVYLYEGGWAASFVIRDGAVREFTIFLRTYTATAQQALLLPAGKAAAALSALTEEACELIIRYVDDGGTVVSPGWAGR